MHALQHLGEALVALDPKRLAELPLPERLADAVLAARGIRAHEGRRRQMQYIGKLMREVDPAPAAAPDWWAAPAPGDQHQSPPRSARRLLVTTALDRFVPAHPHVARASLVALVREARAERAQAWAPHRYRELFRTLRAAVEPQK